MCSNAREGYFRRSERNASATTATSTSTARVCCVRCSICSCTFCCKHGFAARDVGRLRRDAELQRHSLDFPLRLLLSDSSVRALADAARASKRIVAHEAACLSFQSAVAATIAAAAFP